MIIAIVGSWVDGFSVPVHVKNAQRSENLLDAAEVAEKCGDLSLRDQLLDQAVATVENIPRREQTVAA